MLEKFTDCTATRIHILNIIHSRWTDKTEQKIWIRCRDSNETKVRPKVWDASSQNRKKTQKDFWTGNDELSRTICLTWMSCSARGPFLFPFYCFPFNALWWCATLSRFHWTSSDFWSSAEWVKSNLQRRPAPFSGWFVNICSPRCTGIVSSLIFWFSTCTYAGIWSWRSPFYRLTSWRTYY